MIEKKKEKEKEEKKIIDVPDLDTAALHHHHPWLTVSPRCIH